MYPDSDNFSRRVSATENNADSIIKVMTEFQLTLYDIRDLPVTYNCPEIEKNCDSRC